jgi:TPR repeat protein
MKLVLFSLLAVLFIAIALGISGLRLTMGISAPSETMFAKQSLQLLSLVGHPVAPHMLASMKLFQTDNKYEQKEGFALLTKEANDGSCYSKGKIGWAYQKGLGVDSDINKALELYKQAAECGMTYWQILLSHAYQEGYLGLSVNPEKAKYWKEMEPKVHVVIHECWVALYYQDGTFPKDVAKEKHYQSLCDSSSNSSE